MNLLTPFVHRSLFDGYLESLDSFPMADTPGLKVQRNDKEYLLRVKLPGVNKEDLKIEVEDGHLSISGKYEKEQETEYENVHSEFSNHSEFKRTVALDLNRIEIEQVSANLKNGLLEVTLPLKEAVKAKQISIKAS